MRVMLDTNIIISAALFPSGSVLAFLGEISARHRICVCTHSREELSRVIKRKFPGKEAKMAEFIAEHQFEMIPVPPRPFAETIPAMADEGDSLILASAILSGVDALLTGDRHFAGLNLERPQVLTPAEFRARHL